MSESLENQNQVGTTKNSGVKKLNLSQLNLNSFSDALSNVEIPRLFYQLVVFIIDGSNSMNQKSKNGVSKGIEIDKGLKLVIERLKKSKNSNSFDICFLAFSDEFSDVFKIKNVNKFEYNQSFNPLDFVSPLNTSLEKTLIYCEDVVQKYLDNNQTRNCQVLIQILSDGVIDDYEKSLIKIEKIKKIKNTTVACQFLESFIEDGQKWYSYDEASGILDYNKSWTVEEIKEDEKRTSEKFGRFASSQELFVTSIDPEEIRKHMIKSISTISKID